MVEYDDGSTLAQLGTPDMRTPISYALGWPKRIPAPASRLDFANLTALTFEKPDVTRFPALRLAREALQLGPYGPAVLNAANEQGVAAFMAARIGFLDIARVVEDTMGRFFATRREPGSPTLEAVYQADAEARQTADRLIADIGARH
jgi:1-deoxy-D-xylulose-5-phosphate reductoisomerase